MKNRLFYFVSYFAVLSVVAVVLALFLFGTPWQRRMLEADNKLIEQVNTINCVVQAYEDANHRLPANESELLLIGPEKAYGIHYKLIDPRTKKYQLCAKFKTKANHESNALTYSTFARFNSNNAYFCSVPYPLGEHNSGYYCYDLSIQKI